MIPHAARSSPCWPGLTVSGLFRRFLRAAIVMEVVGCEWTVRFSHRCHLSEIEEEVMTIDSDKYTGEQR
ncbi:hypothetical protein GBA52_016344 [Prunus armeniaca]|nr:hypothetical protein GBA52_016344 [Prunus armeniaca]